MDEAKGMKVLLADEINAGRVHSCSRARIGSAIEDRQLCDRASRAFDGQYLLPAAR
jgi:hypothetical protein